MSEAISKQFLRVSFNWQELDVHTDDDRAIFAFSCLAICEINTLKNILLQTINGANDEATVNRFVAVQQNILIRIVSAKLLEFSNAIEGKAAKCRDTSTAVKSIISGTISEIMALKHLPGWKIAKDLRDKAAFHYDIGAIRKNIRSNDSDFSADFLIEKNAGNCLFDLGEIIANGNRTESDLDDLRDWVISMSSISEKFHLGVLNAILPQEFCSGRGRLEEVFFPNDLVSNPSTRLPVIRFPS